MKKIAIIILLIMTIITPTFADDLNKNKLTILDYIKNTSVNFNINIEDIHKEDNWLFKVELDSFSSNHFNEIEIVNYFTNQKLSNENFRLFFYPRDWFPVKWNDNYFKEWFLGNWKIFYRLRYYPEDGYTLLKLVSNWIIAEVRTNNEIEKSVFLNNVKYAIITIQENLKNSDLYINKELNNDLINQEWLSGLYIDWYYTIFKINCHIKEFICYKKINSTQLYEYKDRYSSIKETEYGWLKILYSNQFKRVFEFNYNDIYITLIWDWIKNIKIDDLNNNKVVNKLLSYYFKK